MDVTRECLVDVLYTKPTPPQQLPPTSVGFRDEGTRNYSTCSNDVTSLPEFEFIPTNKRIGNHSDKSRFLIKNYTLYDSRFILPRLQAGQIKRHISHQKNDFYKTSTSRSYSLFVLQFSNTRFFCETKITQYWANTLLLDFEF